MVFVALFAFKATSVFAYPPYAANSNLVIVGPYDSATVGGTNWGMFIAGDHYREFLTVGQQYRIRQTGTISRVRIYTADTSTLTGFYVKVWRKNGANYDLVGTSNNIASSLVSGTSTTIDLSTTITGVQEGDYYGYRLERTNGTLNLYNFSAKSVTGVTTYYVTDSTPSSPGYAWESQSSSVGYVLPIELYMQAPQFAFIGNSIIAGHPIHYSFLETAATTNIASTIENQFNTLTSYTYQNMGIGSQTTANIAARFTADIINLHPKVVVIEGGVNDIAGSVAKSTFIANWTSMLTAAQNASDISNIVVLKILPLTNGPNTQMQTRDDWNNSLTTLAAGYSKAIVVDASSYVGQFRSGGDAENLWDIQTAYNADGVHFNTAGHGQIAQTIADVLDSTSPTISSITSTSSSGSYTTDQAINITVNFSENVTSTGNITVTLNTTPSRTCTFTVSATNTGSCTYTVQSGDTSAGLEVSEISGTIKDNVLNQLTNFTPITTLSASKNIVIDTTAPTISSISSGTPTSTGAIITWTTNEDSSSKVDYGLTNSYGSSTTETDTPAGVTSHSVTLSSLSTCTTYHYRVRSIDTALNETVDSDNTFTTTGCASSSTSSSNNFSSTSAPSCSDTPPGSKAPWLYGAIAQDSGSVLLYFTEADNPVNKYVLEYGTKSGDYPYGVQDMGVNSRWQMTFLVKSLTPNTTYYFRVRGGNGCATGSWSNELSAKTKPIFSTNNLDFVSSELNVVNNPTPTSIPATTKSQAPGPAFAEATAGKYVVKVKVVNTNKKPIEGAKVTIHSKVQETTTGKDGIALFNSVEPGQHKILIAYSGYTGEQTVNLTGDVKEFDFNIQVKEQSAFLNPKVMMIIGILVVIIAGMGILLINRRKGSR